MQPLKQVLVASLLAASSLASLAQDVIATSPFSALYVFGDSLSDGGNNYLSLGGSTGPNPTSSTFIPTLPYASSATYKTYSNGNVWVSGFAAGLGLSSYANPSAIGGGDYAYGGARMTGTGGFPPSVATQVGTYLATGAAPTATSLYVIAGGGNDVRDVGAAVAGGADLATTTLAAAQVYASAAAQMVGTLKAAGAKDIVVWDVPDVGKTPASGSGVGSTAQAASFIAGTFNSFLSTALAGTGAVIFDIYGLIDSFVANPAAYGFANVTQACGFAGNGCSAATSLFWDGIHPTAFAQGLVANAMLAAVPEVGTGWMFMAGLVAFAATKRRRA